MRDRYVLQVLLATLGTGLLMAIIAVVGTPPNLRQPSSNIPAGAVLRTEQSRGDVPTNSAAHSANFKDECDLPFHASVDCPDAAPQPTCVTSSTHQKRCGEHSRKAPLKHC